MHSVRAPTPAPAADAAATAPASSSLAAVAAEATRRELAIVLARLRGVARGASFSPRRLALRTPFGLDGRQQDATEVAGWLLDECGPATDRSFKGKLRALVNCKACGHGQSRDEPFADLCVQVTGASAVSPDAGSAGEAAAQVDPQSVAGLVEAYLQPEGLCDYRCDSCGAVGTSSRRYEIADAPAELIITLKRFAFTSDGGQQKVDSRISVDEALTLQCIEEQPPSLSSDDAVSVRYEYQLYAIVVHAGSTPHSGHYYCLGRHLRAGENMEGPWQRYDDATVRALPTVATQEQLDDLSNGAATAYILFYRRRDVQVPSQRRPSGIAAATALLDELKQVSSDQGSRSLGGGGLNGCVPSPRGGGGGPSGAAGGGSDLGFGGGGGWGVC
eukprot:TRINITY_DN28958_c0_g2_i2.p1 TRINITY_DN28958_c0_g2~~TRINITY_DN28958_c0_g2_i2.p1  ORF type:complete len:431 (-),score=99.52 TRINITY_DN28958_c0_g2_i2:79-1242(-)